MASRLLAPRVLLTPLLALSCAASAAASSQTAAPASPGVSAGLGLLASPDAGTPPRHKANIEPSIIQRIVRDNFAGMRKCYEDGLGRNPNLTGKISTRFVIELDGHVSSAMDVHDAPPPGPLESARPPAGPISTRRSARRSRAR
jgi:hypothetical protein